MTHPKTTVFLLPGVLVAGTVACAALMKPIVCRRRACRLCGHTIEGSFHDIQLSIFCVDCNVIRLESHTPGNYSISEEDAIQLSGCSSRDLSFLKHSVFPQPELDAVPQRQFLMSEVLYVRNRQRKKQAETLLRFKLKDVHPSVRYFLLGDYLTLLTESRTTLQSVLMYKDVVHRATEIVVKCHRAHPQAALEFCKKYPDGGPREFQEMKRKIRKVFHLEGKRIFHGLTDSERQLLVVGPLADVCEEFYAEKPEDVIRGYLKQWFHKISIDAIMDDDGWKNFEWASGSEDRVAPKLKTFWEEKLRRKEMLTNALKGKKLLMPESCINCEAYLNGNDELSLKEIVAGVDLSKNLQIRVLTKLNGRDFHNE